MKIHLFDSRNNNEHACKAKARYDSEKYCCVHLDDETEYKKITCKTCRSKLNKILRKRPKLHNKDTISEDLGYKISDDLWKILELDYRNQLDKFYKENGNR